MRFLLALFLLALAPPAAAQTRMTVASYGGSNEDIMRRQVIPPFERTHNVRIDYLAGNSTDNLARLQAQRGRQEISVVQLDDGVMYQAIALGFCAPVEAATLAALYPIARVEGRAIGTAFNATGFGYNTRIFAERGLAPPTSWNDLFRPEFRGRLSIPGIDNTYGLHTLVMLARLHGGGEANIDPGFRMMRERVNPNVLAYESSPGKMSELFQNNEIWIAIWGTSRLKALRDSGFPVAYVAPTEGAVVLMTTACAVEGGPQPALAQAFLRHLSSPEIQRANAAAFASGPTNPATTLSPEEAREVIYGEAQVRNLVTMDWAAINRVRTEWTRRWQREVER
jgi:putative spermidine/putrescine transport system substrate-binding protein